MNTIHAKLVAKTIESVKYIIYVFQNLDGSGESKYITVTRLPNWEQPDLEIGDVGYLEYKEVRAGIDKWYNVSSGNLIDFAYSEIYFVKFIFEQPNKAITVD